MPASTPTLLLPALVVDPVDHVLVDIATGRHRPGDGIHAEQLAAEHGLTDVEAERALADAWQLGLISRATPASPGLVCWTPEVTQVLLHRLARALVAAVGAGRRSDERRGVIDGDRRRLTVIELFGLEIPSDVDLFLEVSRAVLGAWHPTLVDEVVMPIAVLFSESAQRVHNFEPAAPQEVRCELVRAIVVALLDGRVAEFEANVADYVLALSTH